MNRKWIAALLAAITCVSAAGCSAGGGSSEPSSASSGEKESTSGTEEVVHPPKGEVTYSTYGSFWMRNHDCETMPVAVFNALPPQMSDYTYNYLASERTIADYAEAGVNTLFGLYELCTSKEVETALDRCYDYNIAYVVNMGGANDLTESSAGLHNLDRVKWHDAFAGVMSCDEPGKVMFEDIARSHSVLDSYTSEAAKGTLWHVNLFPNYATQRQLYYRVNSGDLPEGGYTYEQYVSEYMSVVKPKVLSYDYYPCQGKTGNLSSGYFDNMAIIRRYAAESNVPFWVYIQACSFGGLSRLPSEGDLLWQVNTALCYGAKGIQYFCGVTPSDGGGEKFVGSLFDRDGNRTEIYDYAKRANLQIAAVDEVLMRSVSKGIVVGGGTPWGEVTGIPQEDILSGYGKLTGLSAAHALAGCFDYDGLDAYYVVDNSSVEEDEIVLTFSSPVRGYYVQNTVKKQFEGNSLTLKTTAGEGVLVVTE
ncbi:MAG: hypothetical protein SOT34_02520 [Candidatus Borkfalkiaceae bacterium]|nr:hypothetical protein [Christensenellaceae bacterium]